MVLLLLPLLLATVVLLLATAAAGDGDADASDKRNARPADAKIPDVVGVASCSSRAGAAPVADASSSDAAVAAAGVFFPHILSCLYRSDRS